MQRKNTTSITVIGMGYIGLPTALLLASAGHVVYGVDVVLSKIQLLQKGKLPFHEPGLNELFSSIKKTSFFRPTTKISKTDCYIIAVPTPQIHHKADLSYVLGALQSILPFLTPSTLIIIESTIGPSDCEKTILPFLSKHTANVHLAHCPERAIPGNTIHEMQYNARIVGGLTAQDAERTKTIYKTFVKGEIHTTNLVTAAACKVMENTFRDVNIALANELAKIADDVHFNVWEAIRLANLHPRVAIHNPGPGVGGHCIAIDPWYFVGESKEARLISKARHINDGMPLYVAKKIHIIVRKHRLQNPTIGIVGYAYKKNVDDARETPIEELINHIQKRYSFLLHDPLVTSMKHKNDSLENVLANSDILILAVDHDQFKSIHYNNYPRIQVIFDTRNMLSQSHVFLPTQHVYTLGDGLLQ